MPRPRSRIKGSKSFRRLMRQMPDAMHAEMEDVLARAQGPATALVQSRVDATTRRRTGALRAGVKSKLLRKSLRLQVGFLGTPRGRARLFYARILDLGRKASTVTVHRRRVGMNSGLSGGRKIAGDIASVYRLRITRIAPKRFVTGGLGQLGSLIGNQLRGAWDRGLRRIASGSD